MRNPLKKTTIVSVTHNTRKRSKTKTVEFNRIHAKRHIFDIVLSHSESVRVEVKL